MRLKQLGDLDIMHDLCLVFSAAETANYGMFMIMQTFTDSGVELGLASDIKHCHIYFEAVRLYFLSRQRHGLFNQAGIKILILLGYMHAWGDTYYITHNRAN